MKVLHIMAGRRNGGAETYCADLILSLHSAGVDQCVVMSSAALRFPELLGAGVRMAPEVLSVPILPMQRLRLARLIAREKPDVVHCWMRRAASLMPKIRKPVIGWFGDLYDPSYFHNCTHFVGVTRDIVADIEKDSGVAARADFIPTFPGTYDVGKVDRASLATPPDSNILLTLSRLHPKKGLDTLLQALAGLPDCILWMAGDGPMRRELGHLALKLGVDQRVRFLGWRTDRAALLHAADVCVLPSRYEPFGTVILEAWAARTPLVACASTGPAAHVHDGVDGLLSPIDDARALKENLRRALSDADLRRRLTEHGHAAYLKAYTRETVTGQWIDYYRGIAGRQPG